MNIQIKQYTQTHPIPQLLLRKNEDFEFLMCATPWGDNQGVELAFDEIEQYLTAALQDTEVTSPFERFEFYEKELNELRIALLLANEKVYRSVNQQEYVSSCELTILLRNKNRIYFAMIGDHQLLLRRKNQLEVISSQGDPSDHGFPVQMLGIYKQCLPRCGAVSLQDGDLCFLQSSGGLLLPETNYDFNFERAPSKRSFTRGAWLSLVRWS